MHRKSYQLNIGRIATIGIISALGYSALLPSQNVSATSSLTLSLPQAESTPYTAELYPTSSDTSFASIVVPIGITGVEVEAPLVQISTANNNTSLVGKNKSTNRIPTLESEVSQSNFKTSSDYNNRWGYRLASLTTNSSLVQNTAGITSDSTIVNSATNTTWGSFKNTKLAQENFKPLSPRYIMSDPYELEPEKDNGTYSGLLALELAAKVDSTTSRDTYEGDIYIYVTADAFDTSTMFDITDMQQMTSRICKNTPTPSVDADKAILNRKANPTTTANGSWTKEDGNWVGTPNNTDNSMAYSTTNAATTLNTELANYTANPSTYRSNYVPQTVLQDTRDNKYYLVRKLADGRCWMSSNLDYNFKDTNGDGVVDFDPTDGQTDWDSTLAWSSYSSKLNVTNSWSDDNTNMRSYSSVTANKPFASRNGTSYTDATSGVMEDFRGTWYNWYAATIGTGTLTANKQAESSICPKGWKLPTGGASGDFQNLFTTYGQTAQKATNFPLNFSFSGSYGSGSAQGTTDYGAWWSSVAKDTSLAYDLYMDSSSVYPQGYNYPQFGVTVRCVSTPTAAQ